MKNSTLYIKFLVFGLLIGFAASCTDLTETPYDEVTTENFNPTSEDVLSLIAPAYSELRPMWQTQNGYVDVQEEPADAHLTPTRPDGWFDGGTYIRLHQHTWTSTQSQPRGLYNRCYNGINAINRVIHQVQSGTIPVGEDIQSGLFAELKTLRAFYYFLLLDNFGNVPIVTDYSSEEVPDQNTRQELYDFVVEELTTNIPQLTETADQSTYGRINKWVGKVILADVYLNAGVYTGTPEWEKVIEVTDEIIESNRYQLEESYKSNFTRDNIESSENMWVIVYDEVNAPGNRYHMKTGLTEFNTIYNMRASPWRGSSANPQFIDTYDEDDTRLEDTWIYGPQYDDNGDLVVEILKDIPAIQSSENEDHHGYSLGKYEIYEGLTSHSDVDIPIYRYADVLLMQAEALLRSGSADDAAVLVTQVRERAFEDPAEAEVTGAQLQLGSTYNYGWWENGQVVNAEGGGDIEYGRMLDELGWEFAVEAHRRQDMIRFGVFTTKTWFNHTPNGEYRRLFPLPLGALQDNSKLEQNPGY